MDFNSFDVLGSVLGDGGEMWEAADFVIHQVGGGGSFD